MKALDEIRQFLASETGSDWVDNALNNIDLLLIDHAHCEKKAASSALNLIYRYSEKPALLHKMSRLAREELRHFEQVLAILAERGTAFYALEASSYAKQLRQPVRQPEPYRLVDQLIIGAFIEARSCERFACLYPHLDEKLGQFYFRLLRSEARHFKDYLRLAEQYSPEPIEKRVAFFAELEASIIAEPDSEFRFHSGPVREIVLA